MPPSATVHGRLILNRAFSGGPAGLLYGFIIVWAGTAAVFASLSELASMYAHINTTKSFLNTAGHLPLGASITGSSCLRHALHGGSSAMSQAGSNHYDQLLQASDELQAGSLLGDGRLM